MTVHLKKLSVGSESLASLRQWQGARRKAGFELMHVTRNMPVSYTHLTLPTISSV